MAVEPTFRGIFTSILSVRKFNNFLITLISCYFFSISPYEANFTQPGKAYHLPIIPTICNSFKQGIEQQRTIIGVIGLGYVGLPLRSARAGDAQDAAPRPADEQRRAFSTEDRELRLRIDRHHANSLNNRFVPIAPLEIV